MRGAHRRCARLYGDGGWRGKFLRIPYESHRCGAIHRRQPKSGPQELGESDEDRKSSQNHRFYLSGSVWSPGSGRAGVGYGRERHFRVSRGIHLRRRAAQARPVRGAAVGGRHPHPHHPFDRAQPADRGLRDGYRHRVRRWRSPWRRPAALASCIATSSRTSRPPRSARSRNSSPAWWSIRSPSAPMRRWPMRWR